MDGGRLSHVDTYLREKDVCLVECIMEVGEEEVEEDVLFINQGYTSVTTQTDDSHYFSTCQPYIPGVPVFYCGQPSPGTANTQCFIPSRADACVGTDPSDPCSSKRRGTHLQSKPNASHYTSLSTNTLRNNTVKTEIVLEAKKENFCLQEQTGQPSTAAPERKANASHLPAVTHKKRGRKRKTALAREERGDPYLSHQTLSASDRISARRKRRRKRDNDFEYEMGHSEGEADLKVKDEYNDRDEEWIRVKVEQNDENNSSSDAHNNDTDKTRNDIRVASPLIFCIEECDSIESDYKTVMDKKPKNCDESNDYKNKEGGDVFYSNLVNTPDTNINTQVLTVNFTDLESERNTLEQLKKYSEKAKAKYHQEKVIREDGKVVYQCQKCNKETETRAQLREHRRVHTAKGKLYECTDCDKVFTEARRYYAHLGFHKQLFECQPCGRRFSLLGNLKKHLTTHEGAPDQVCGVCGSQFMTTSQLQQHHLTQHQEDNVREYKKECEHCGKKYVREEAYKQHLSGTPYKCSLCEVSEGCETKLRTHIRNQHGRCVCEFCGKSFKKNSLIHHIKVVHREACVPCPHCPKKFTYRSKMLAHVDANHSKEKKYKCGLCDYTARTVNTLNLHRRRNHRDPSLNPQYCCKICPRKFHLPSKLALHYRVHTGEKPYSCQSCGKAFSTKYNQAEHERCVHGERVLLQHPDGSSSVRVVKHRRAPRAPGRRCELCGLDLPTSWAMVTHMKEQHNAQKLPNSPAKKTLEAEESEAVAVVDECKIKDEQYQAEVESGEQEDLLLNATPGVVSIPEYATHVEIDGVEYQVLRN